MKSLKTIFLSGLILLLSQYALAQSHDAFSPDHTEPIKSVKVFPNPATDYLSIKFETPLARTVRMTLHNIIGNNLEVESEIVDDYEIRVKVKELPSGVYFLALKDPDSSQNSFKFLKR